MVPLSVWAESAGVSRRVAYKWAKSGVLPAELVSGKLCVPLDTPVPETRPGRPVSDPSTKKKREKDSQRAYRERKKCFEAHLPQANGLSRKGMTSEEKSDLLNRWFLGKKDWDS